MERYTRHSIKRRLLKRSGLNLAFLAVISFFGSVAADAAPLCVTAATLQDLIDFGAAGCTLPENGRTVSSWSFEAHFLVSGESIPADTFSVSIDPLHPPAEVFPSLFNILFTGLIIIPQGETLMLSLDYQLDDGPTNTPAFYYSGPLTSHGLLGTDISDSPSLCVGGVFSLTGCSGTLFERTFLLDGPIGGFATSAANSISFTDSSDNRDVVLIPGSNVLAAESSGLQVFGVDAAGPPPALPAPEPGTSRLYTLGSLALVGLKFRKRLRKERNQH